MDNLEPNNHYKSNLISLILHIVLIWGAFSLKSAHILTPSRSDGIEVSLISSSDIPQPKPVIQSDVVVQQPIVTENLDNADIKIKQSQKLPTPPTKVDSTQKVIPMTKPDSQKKPEAKIKKALPNKNITNELLSQLGVPATTGKSRGRAVGGTRSGTSDSNVLVSNYADLVIQRVRPYIEVPDGIDQNATAVVKVTLLPSMQVYKVQLEQSSGNPYYDNSVQDAINKTGTFPPLPDGAKFVDFRVLYLTFKPE